jgi:1,5-anhydro-D-fructose reductase (1,5-anhydro-D-mannitol-forming)
MSEIGWGFIGASRWAARFMVPAVEAAGDSVAVAVFSSSPARGREFARNLSLRRAHPSLEALLEDGDIDVVYISTTNQLHAAQTIAAAQAGKHVLCEKPLATSFAEAVHAVRECHRASVVMGTNHHLRGAPTIVAMRQLIANGAIGKVIAARVFHARALPRELHGWRLDRPDAGPGVILDITVHDADTVRYLLDDEIVEVTAMAANNGLAAAPVEDSVMGVMRTRSGALVSFHDAYTVPHAGTGIEVHGTCGSLLGRDVLAEEPTGEVLLRRDDRVRPVEIPRRWRLYEHAVARFNAAVRGGGSPLASGDDGLASLAIALAARASAQSGAPATPARIAPDPSGGC